MMALRHRLTIMAAGTVGITVVLISVVAYLVLSSELHRQVDDALTSQFEQVRATHVSTADPGRAFPLHPRATAGLPDPRDSSTSTATS